MLSNLKACLAARRWRQADLAAQLGMHASATSEIVVGRREASLALGKKIWEPRQESRRSSIRSRSEMYHRTVIDRQAPVA